MVTIERLDPTKWTTLRDVRLAALRDAPDAFWATWDDENQYTTREWANFARHVTWFVASQQTPEETRNVGLVGCKRRHEFPDEPEIIGMWVRPDQRGTGTADLLINAAHRWAIAENASSLALWVVDRNERAWHFYQRHGYQPTGELAPLPNQRPGHEHRMRRTCSTAQGPR